MRSPRPPRPRALGRPPRWRGRASLLALGLVVGGLAPAHAGPAPRGPGAPKARLAVVDATHRGAVRALTLVEDAPGGAAVYTAGDDKTVRRWTLDGRAGPVLRPPAGPGHQGQIFALGTARGGAVLVGGGFPVEGRPGLFTHALRPSVRREAPPDVAWTGAGTVRALATGTDVLLVGQAPGPGALVPTSPRGKAAALPERIQVAAASGDGRRLAAATRGGHVLVFDGRGHALGPGFDVGGEVADLALVGEGGEALAVARLEARVVEIRQLPTGRVLRTLPCDIGFVDRLVATAGGRRLVAAVVDDQDGAGVLFTWDLVGREPPRAVRVSDDVVTALTASRAGVLFGTYGGAWGLFDPVASRLVHRVEGAGLAVVSGTRLAVSPEGRRVELTTPGGGFVAFDLDTRALEGPPLSPRLPPPPAPGPAVLRDGRISRDRKPFPLADDDYAHDLAGQGPWAILTEREVLYVERWPDPRWRRPLSSPGRAVGLSPRSGLLVSAHADGTVQFRALADGALLLTLALSADRRAWVTFTPDGAWDASLDGAALAGWEVPREDGWRDLVPLRQLAAAERPDVVEGAFAGGGPPRPNAPATPPDPRPAPRPEDLPRVVLLAPVDGQAVTEPSVTVRFRVEAPGDAPPTTLRVLVDGLEPEIARGFRPTGEITRTVPVPPRDSVITVFAGNQHGAGPAAAARVVWAGRPADVPAPSLYALVVGVAAYPAPLTLKWPGQDARDVAALLERQVGALYRKVEVRTLTDEEARRGAILEGLEWLERQTTTRDVAVIFLAGHGLLDEQGEGWFLPVDGDAERLRGTGLAFDEISRTGQRIAGKAVVLLDACHAGATQARTRAVPARLDRALRELAAADNGLVVFASSTGRQVSVEDDRWQNGAFTEALLEGLAGRADFQGTGRVTVAMLDVYVSERVKELTGGRQTPASARSATLPDFPLVWSGLGGAAGGAPPAPRRP